MLFKPTAATLFAGLIKAIRAADIDARAAESPSIFVVAQVCEHLVVVNQYCETNTVLSISGVTITVKNAPTQLSTTITATTTDYVTSTA